MANINNKVGTTLKCFETSNEALPRTMYKKVLEFKLYEMRLYHLMGLRNPINFNTDDCVDHKLDSLDGKTILIIYSLLYGLSQLEYDFSGEAFDYICTHSCTAREVYDYIMNEYYK